LQTEKRSIRSDYLSGAETLTPFYRYPFPDSAVFPRILSDKSKENIARSDLADVLTAQYGSIGDAEKSLANIEKLRLENTFTVTTGHQTVLFGGPLFTVYKVLHTIRLAAWLSRQHPEKHFVPVFWIHTEDHDFEEINHFFESFDLKRTYNGDFTGPVGEHILGKEIENLVPSHFPEELKSPWSEGKSLGKAYFSFMQALFGEYGLVILDASHPRLKKHFVRVMAEELDTQPVSKRIAASSERLKLAGYNPQINPRRINLFYLGNGSRKRILKKEGGFSIEGSGHFFSKDDMMAELTTHPEHFSPNVSLRPLYQEMILPNLAYIGGWGEIAYWLQLKDVFSHFGVNFPLLIPRFSATLVKNGDWEAWESLGLDPGRIREPLHDNFRDFIPALWQEDEFKLHGARLLAAWDEMETYMIGIMDTMGRSVAAQKAGTEKFLDATLKKIHKVIRQKNPGPFAAIEAIKQKVQPDHQVQERVLSLAAFPENNPYELLRLIAKEVAPFDNTHKIIRIS
jgi:bacillithiol biosynthesis cysteine-adding enzyme BshC